MLNDKANQKNASPLILPMLVKDSFLQPMKPIYLFNNDACHQEKKMTKEANLNGICWCFSLYYFIRLKLITKMDSIRPRRRQNYCENSYFCVFYQHFHIKNELYHRFSRLQDYRQKFFFYFLTKFISQFSPYHRLLVIFSFFLSFIIY